MLLLDLIHNIALLVALSVLLPLVARRWGPRTLAGRLISGALFGAVVLVGMLTPVDIGSGVIFDGRSIVLCAAGVIGGPLVAGVAAIMAAAYRIYLGGAGVFMGVSVIVESAALGSVYWYLRGRVPNRMRPAYLLVLGLLVHVIMVALMSTLPGAVRGAALREIALIVLTVYPLATAAVCWVLLEDEGRLATRDALAHSEGQLKLAIEGSRTGLWDWSIPTGAVEVNDMWAAIIGRTRAELAPLTFARWRELLHPDDRPQMERTISRHLAGDTPYFTSEYRMLHKDGRWVWIVATGQVTERDAAGEPVRMTGTHIDTSARKATEAELYESHAQMERMVLDVAEAMGRIVEARDPYTQGHEQRVAALARSIADRMGLTEDEADEVEMAGLLHDVGKLHIPAEILTKPGKLSEAEFALIREHPVQGHEILKDISFPWRIADIVLQHHERMDGSGYPSGIRGADIMLPARILAVADVVEAMASHRPYRASLGLGSAIEEIRGDPEKYDASAVAACVELYEAGLIVL